MKLKTCLLIIIFIESYAWATLIPKSEIQVFGTEGWGYPGVGNPARTIDGSYDITYWNGTDDIQYGQTNWLAYRFNNQYNISQIDLFSHPQGWSMGDLDIQISDNSTDGL